jgi:ferredoxin--NADP+ reductase
LGAGKSLVHASRSPAGFYFHELFEARLGSRYIPCRPGTAAAPETPAGSASVAHAAASAAHAAGNAAAPGGARPGGLLGWIRDSELPPDRRYLLCGSARMVVEVREALIARGVPFGNILAEIYF